MIFVLQLPGRNFIISKGVFYFNLHRLSSFLPADYPRVLIYNKAAARLYAVRRLNVLHKNYRCVNLLKTMRRFRRGAQRLCLSAGTHFSDCRNLIFAAHFHPGERLGKRGLRRFQKPHHFNGFARGYPRNAVGKKMNKIIDKTFKISIFYV